MRLVAILVSLAVLGAYAAHGRFGRLLATIVALVVAALAWIAISGSVLVGDW